VCRDGRRGPPLPPEIHRDDRFPEYFICSVNTAFAASA
jgi:hypothetical protein